MAAGTQGPPGPGSAHPGTDPTAAPDPPPPSGAASLRASRPSGHEAAAAAWVAASEAHRRMAGEPCARCGALAVELAGSAGYRCGECGYVPPEAPAAWRIVREYLAGGIE